MSGQPGRPPEHRGDSTRPWPSTRRRSASAASWATGTDCSALGRQATILSTRGELDQALALHKEEERICRELGDRDGLQLSLGNQGRPCLRREIRSRPSPAEGTRADLPGAGERRRAAVLAGEPSRGSSSPRGARHGHGPLRGAGADLPRSGRTPWAAVLPRQPGHDPRRPWGARHGHGPLRGAGADLARQRLGNRSDPRAGTAGNSSASATERGILLAHAGRADQALALVEEAYSIAVSSGLKQVAGQIDSVRAKLREA